MFLTSNSRGHVSELGFIGAWARTRTTDHGSSFWEYRKFELPSLSPPLRLLQTTDLSRELPQRGVIFGSITAPNDVYCQLLVNVH
jgi:hypothetical protein